MEQKFKIFTILFMQKKEKSKNFIIHLEQKNYL